MYQTCSGTMEKSGRRASGFTVQSIDEKTQVELPTLIKCDMMPENRFEIPTPDVTQYFPHLKPVADKIPEHDPVRMLLQPLPPGFLKLLPPEVGWLDVVQLD